MAARGGTQQVVMLDNCSGRLYCFAGFCPRAKTTPVDEDAHGTAVLERRWVIELLTSRFFFLLFSIKWNWIEIRNRGDR